MSELGGKKRNAHTPELRGVDESESVETYLRSVVCLWLYVGERPRTRWTLTCVCMCVYCIYICVSVCAPELQFFACVAAQEWPRLNYRLMSDTDCKSMCLD